MNYDYYLKFAKPDKGGKEIKGSVQAAHHAGWIDLTSFSFGTSTRSFATGESATLRELQFSTADGAAFSAIFLGCADGTHYPDVTIELTRNDQVSWRLVATDVLITSVSTGSSYKEPVPILNCAIHFAKAAVKYFKASEAPQPWPAISPGTKTK